MGITRRPQSKYLPSKLLWIRETLHLTQAEIIQKLDYEWELTQGMISNFETGKREAPVPLIVAYARLFGVSTDFLIDDKFDLTVDSKLNDCMK
ncbi:MAG TPA: helix-turn-helix transcriptional regulator [Pyrinomonadaceae bacterium]|jgi:transcriptional regulator with XRE-family HTH domain